MNRWIMNRKLHQPVKNGLWLDMFSFLRANKVQSHI